MEEEYYNSDEELLDYGPDDEELLDYGPDEDLDAEKAAMEKRLKELEAETAALRQAAKQLADSNDAGAAESDGRSVFVGNVDYGCTPEELQQHFESCGQVNRVTIKTDKFGQPMGFAYLEFVDREGAEKAVSELNESVVHGRQIKVMAKRTNVPGMKQIRGRPCPRSRSQYGRVPRFRRSAARYTPYI